MKRRLSFLVAALAVTASTQALAQQDPGKMFVINAVTPGVVSFSGEGTAQFNNSSSTANAFSVGSSTNFGVNASASSTNDYMVDSNALLQLAGTSQLQQTIGTSSSAANTMAAAEAAATSANTLATSQVETKYGQNWADYNSIKAGSVNGSKPEGFTTEDFKTEAAYNAAKDTFTKTATSEAYAKVTEAANSSSSQGASGQGIISGEFVTSNKSRSDIGATAAIVADNTSKATTEANNKFGTTYTDYTTKFGSYDKDGNGVLSAVEGASAKADGYTWNEGAGKALDNATWTSSKSTFMNSTYSSLANSAKSAGSSESESTATVTVTGVGSIATLNASDDSAFNVDVATRIRNQIMATNGTANGSAGGNLATSSFANQSNTQTASAFMQAFGADTVDLVRNETSGVLETAIVNGRFDVKLDAAPTTPGGALDAPVITVPK